MNIRTILFAFVVGTFTLSSAQVFAQTMQNEQELNLEQDSVKQKAIADKARMQEAADLRRSTRAHAKAAKATAREADRIEDDAADAAREARQASRMEARAQRNRAHADKQAKKAARAIEKSDGNQ